MPESFANLFETTIATVGGINASATSWSVSDTTRQPLAPFRAVIFDGTNYEYILVGGVSGTSWSSVTRAVEDSGTLPARAWPQGTKIRLVLTAAMGNLFNNTVGTGHSHTGAAGDGPLVNPYGTWANRPAAGSVGRTYFASDGYHFSADNGANGWNTFFTNGPSSPPSASGWTLYNAGTSYYSTGGGSVTLNIPSSNGDNQVWLARAWQSGDWTLDVALRPGFSPNRLSDVGIGVFNSSTGKSLVNRFHHEGSGTTYTGHLQYSIAYYSSWTALSQNIISPGGANWMMIGGYLWLRLVYTTSDDKLDFWLSADGRAWMWPAGPSGKRVLSTDLGGSSSDWRIGFYANAPSNAQGASVTCYSWNGVS